MPTYKIKCPKCKEEFTKESIILLQKNKKEVEEAKLKDLAPKVQDLIAQISKKTINIKKITVITADREQQLQQTNNPGMSLEVTIVPGLEPK
jgi:uncharacterized Zn finger protein (UPF0148 family)